MHSFRICKKIGVAIIQKFRRPTFVMSNSVYFEKTHALYNLQYAIMINEEIEINHPFLKNGSILSKKKRSKYS